ncbi:conserved hypothetical protein [Mesorhizobium plurifarium]|uniref:DUF3102 domain-containing protein n=1 Tax=Mesorhizobium plurifarium TaxID=69974 RepID=A0A090E5C5_MESPL|nr:conserved hypothetical protein [Mesorhizobium plurifarium]
MNGNIGAWGACGARNATPRVLAFGCGMTVRQFAKLPPDRQQAVHRAYLTLMLPPEPEPADNDAVALPGGRWSTEIKLRVGCWLNHIKSTLPHGHFGPWVEKQSGLSHKMALQCMALAREARQRAIEARAA